MIAKDKDIFEETAGKAIDLEIIKIIAVHDDLCKMIYDLKG